MSLEKIWLESRGNNKSTEKRFIQKLIRVEELDKITMMMNETKQSITEIIDNTKHISL